jgi:hypothetical protein
VQLPSPPGSGSTERRSFPLPRSAQPAASCDGADAHPTSLPTSVHACLPWPGRCQARAPLQRSCAYSPPWKKPPCSSAGPRSPPSSDAARNPPSGIRPLGFLINGSGRSGIVNVAVSHRRIGQRANGKSTPRACPQRSRCVPLPGRHDCSRSSGRQRPVSRRRPASSSTA